MLYKVLLKSQATSLLPALALELESKFLFQEKTKTEWDDLVIRLVEQTRFFFLFFISLFFANLFGSDD